MMRTTNPALNSRVFQRAGSAVGGEVMTLQGTVNKTMILLFLLVMSASWVWNQAFQAMGTMQGLGEAQASSTGAMVVPLMIGGVIVGLIAAMVTIFKKEWAPISAPVYAIAEGLFLGGISAFFEQSYPGIVFQAVALTFGTLFCLLLAYQSKLIQVTENFKLGIVAATGAICLVYFINIIMGFFGSGIPLIHGNGIFGIGFSFLVVGIAALNLVLDFDFIESGANAGVPKYMEWYGAFGLMVTLVWLYIEILRLLSKLRSR